LITQNITIAANELSGERILRATNIAILKDLIEKLAIKQVAKITQITTGSLVVIPDMLRIVLTKVNILKPIQ
jgi:hypothetical protein